MKVAIGQFMQESHSFTSIACSWEQFRAGHIYRGGEIISKVLGNRVELAGALDFAAANQNRHRAAVGLQCYIFRIYSDRRILRLAGGDAETVARGASR